MICQTVLDVTAATSDPVTLSIKQSCQDCIDHRPADSGRIEAAGQLVMRGLLREPAGQRGGLLHPGRHLRLVELVVFVDVDPAHVLAAVRATGRDRSQRLAVEEGHLNVASEDVERQEPALTLDAVKWRVPLHGFAHFGRVAHDDRVEALPEDALPAGHRCDVCLHGGIAVRLRDLRVAA